MAQEPRTQTSEPTEADSPWLPGPGRYGRMLNSLHRSRWQWLGTELQNLRPMSAAWCYQLLRNR